MEQIKAFIEKIKTDESLRLSMESLAEKKADIKEVLKLAEDQGFNFTREEWDSYAKAAFEAKKGEVTDDQLAAVAGGFSWDWDIWLTISMVTVGIMCAGWAIFSKVDQNTAYDCDGEGTWTQN